MKLTHVLQGCGGIARRTPRRIAHFRRGVLACAAVLAMVALAFFAEVAGAEAPRAEACRADALGIVAAQAAWSVPAQGDRPADWSYAAFRGLSCSRCNSRTQYCVINPLRYEYACAPLGTVACISSERTSWCPPGRSCWAGRCQ